MRVRLVLAAAALLALPACLDPIVGTQCAKGYSPCGSKCVLAGSCILRDAGEGADVQTATLPDAALVRPSPTRTRKRWRPAGGGWKPGHRWR